MDLIEFSCGECGQIFETSNSLQNHVDTKHEDLAVLNDRVQSSSSLTNENIEPSSNQANGLIPHDLRTSHSLHSSSNKLVRESLKSDPNDFYCKECNRSFGNNHGLLIHNGRHHKKHEMGQQIGNDDFVTVVRSTKSEADNANRTFSCEPCGKKYDTYHGLLIHNGRFHKDTTTSTRRRRLTCPPNPMNSEKNDFRESGLFSCDDCSKSFDTFIEFIAHANLYHPEPPSDDEGKVKSIRNRVAEIPAKDKSAGEGDGRVKRKSVQISDGKQVVKESEETQPAASRGKRRKYNLRMAKGKGEELAADVMPIMIMVTTYFMHVMNATSPTPLITDFLYTKAEIISVSRLTGIEAEDSGLFVCEDCNKTFDTYHGFLIHAGRYHKSAESGAAAERTSDPRIQIENGSEAVEIDISTYTCGGCDKSFHSEHGLLIHIGRTHHWRTPRKGRRKSTKMAAHENGPAHFVDSDDVPSNGNGQNAIITSGAVLTEINETPEVNERTPTDADPVQNNEMSEQSVAAPNGTTPVEINALVRRQSAAIHRQSLHLLLLQGLVLEMPAWMQEADVTTQDRVEVRVGVSWVGRRRHCPGEELGHALEARSCLLVPPPPTHSNRQPVSCCCDLMASTLP
nr:zinc finger protein [Hymenolepis microstoma]